MKDYIVTVEETYFDALTSGTIVRIDRNELKEDRVYFKELV